MIRPGPPLIAAPRRTGLDGAFRYQRLAIIAVLASVTAAAAVGWVLVVGNLDFRRITDVGIVSILPPAAYGLVGVLAASFMVSLRIRPISEPLLGVQLVALIFMLYGAPALFEEMPRFVTAWLHVGFVEAIAETGQLYPLRDARFDWPGFFVLFAYLSQVLQIDSLLGIIAWVPVVQVTLYLAPLYLIFRSATGDVRLGWLGLWIFVVTNWVGQDYFSPQGLNVLFFLTILAVLLTWFRRAPRGGAWLARSLGRIPLLGRLVDRRIIIDPNGSLEDGPEARLTDRQQIGLVAIVGVIFGTSVASHQLTPFAMIGGVAMLVIFARLRAWSLVVMMGVLVSAWLMFMAATFLQGHLAGLLEDVASPGSFAESNVASRLGGSEGHLLVLQARLAFTAGIWGLAVIGGLRRLRARRLDLSLALLAVAPFGLIFLQGYGGEMLLRIFLFSLPFMAFFAAAAFIPTPRPMSWALSGTLVIVSMVLVVGFVVARYGNEKADLVTSAEYEALEFVIDLADPGDTIASVNHSIPLGYREWDELRGGSLAPHFEEGDLSLLTELLRSAIDDGEQGYLVITRGNEAYAELFQGVDAATWANHLAAITRRPDFEVVFRNRDAVVFRLVEPTTS